MTASEILRKRIEEAKENFGQFDYDLFRVSPDTLPLIADVVEAVETGGYSDEWLDNLDAKLTALRNALEEK